MVEDEDSGDVAKCVICESEKYWECGHLVACFDLSFNECRSGSFCKRIDDFSSLIENSFIEFIKNGIEPNFDKSIDDYKWNELWTYFKESYDGDLSSVVLDDDILKQIYIDILEDCGAFNFGGTLIEDDGPGMTSAIKLLFEDEPEKIVDQAFSSLSKTLLQ